MSWLNVNGSSHDAEYTISDSGSASKTNILGVQQAFRVPIQFGLPFSVQWLVAVGGNVNTRIPSFAFAHLENTSTWEGILAVTDANGQAVPSTFMSASGTDYTHAIPEPATWNFLVVAAAGLAL